MSVQFFVCEALNFFNTSTNEEFQKIRRFGPRVLSVPSEDLPCSEKKEVEKGEITEITEKNIKTQEFFS